MHLVRARALLSLGRLDEAGGIVDGGLLSARDQNLPFEEALLLQVRSALAERLDGADRGISAATDAVDSERILALLGARPQNAVPRS